MDVIVLIAVITAALVTTGVWGYPYLCRRLILPMTARRRGWSCDATPRWVVDGRVRTLTTISGEHRGVRFAAVTREDLTVARSRRLSTEATLFTDLRMPYVVIRFPGVGRGPTVHGDVETVSRLRITDQIDWLPHWRWRESLVSMHGDSINADWPGRLRPLGLLRRLDLLVDVVRGYQTFTTTLDLPPRRPADEPTVV